LNAEFFLQMRRILVPKGTLTVVTDNQWYANLLLDIVNSVKGFKNVEIPSCHVLKTIGGFSLFMGNPTCECGVSTEASSYFDRLSKQDTGRGNMQNVMLVISRD